MGPHSIFSIIELTKKNLTFPAKTTTKPTTISPEPPPNIQTHTNTAIPNELNIDFSAVEANCATAQILRLLNTFVMSMFSRLCVEREYCRFRNRSNNNKYGGSFHIVCSISFLISESQIRLFLDYRFFGCWFYFRRACRSGLIDGISLGSKFVVLFRGFLRVGLHAIDVALWPLIAG